METLFTRKTKKGLIACINDGGGAPQLDYTLFFFHHCDLSKVTKIFDGYDRPNHRVISFYYKGNEPTSLKIVHPLIEMSTENTFHACTVHVLCVAQWYHAYCVNPFILVLHNDYGMQHEWTYMYIRTGKVQISTWTIVWKHLTIAIIIILLCTSCVLKVYIQTATNSLQLNYWLSRNWRCPWSALVGYTWFENIFVTCRKLLQV